MRQSALILIALSLSLTAFAAPPEPNARTRSEGSALIADLSAEFETQVLADAPVASPAEPQHVEAQAELARGFLGEVPAELGAALVARMRLNVRSRRPFEVAHYRVPEPPQSGR